jgi:EmrB/QacA subfamily drug resistance transporter
LSPTLAAPAARTNETADAHHDHRWWTLLCLCLCVVIIGVDNTILNVALPSIVRDLDATGSQLQWIVDGYTVVFACLLLTAGALGDRFGRRRALLFGVAWFGVFSALASFAHSPDQLIAARALMGLGGAFIFPSTLSVLTNVFRDPSERAKAIGIWAGVSGIGIAIGPLLGGVLVEHLGWSSVFFVNVPVCALAFAGAVKFVPKGLRSKDSPLDPLGGILSIGALSALLFSIIEAPEGGWTSTSVVLSFTIAIALIGGFVAWERASADPMLDVRFFSNPRFSAASATVTLTQFALFGSTFLLTQYFQFVLGYSPLKAGLMMTPVALGLMMGAPTAPKLVARHGTKRVVIVGLSIIFVAVACYRSDAMMSTFWLGFAIRLVFGIGLGLTQAPATESIMGSLPPSRAGVGSAVNDTTRQTGGALGVAVLGSIFASHFHDVVRTVPGVTGETAARAQESIGSAQQVARTLPAEQAAQVRDAAHDAFLSSMRVTYAIAAAFVLGAIFVAYRFLPARASDPSTGTVAERDSVSVDMPSDWTPASPPATSTSKAWAPSARGTRSPSHVIPSSSSRSRVEDRL